MSALADIKEYGMALHEKRAIEHQLENLGITGAPSGLHGMGQGLPGTNDRTAAAMQRMDGLEAMLAEKLEALKLKVIRGERALEMIGYAKARVIMRSYYVLGMSDGRIAEEMQISRTTVQRIRQATELDLDAMA